MTPERTRRHKFRPGRTFDAMDAVGAILKGQYLYVNHKPMHPGWMQNWSIRQIEVASARGQLRQAVDNEDGRAVLAAGRVE